MDWYRQAVRIRHAGPADPHASSLWNLLRQGCQGKHMVRLPGGYPRNPGKVTLLTSAKISCLDASGPDPSLAFADSRPRSSGGRAQKRNPWCGAGAGSQSLWSLPVRIKRRTGHGLVHLDPDGLQRSLRSEPFLGLCSRSHELPHRNSNLMNFSSDMSSSPAGRGGAGRHRHRQPKQLLPPANCCANGTNCGGRGPF